MSHFISEPPPRVNQSGTKWSALLTSDLRPLTSDLFVSAIRYPLEVHPDYIGSVPGKLSTITPNLRTSSPKFAVTPCFYSGCRIGGTPLENLRISYLSTIAHALASFPLRAFCLRGRWRRLISTSLNVSSPPCQLPLLALQLNRPINAGCGSW